MSGGATTTNLNDTLFTVEIGPQVIDELRPAMTSRSFLRWGPKGNSTAFQFVVQDRAPSLRAPITLP